MSEHFTSYSRLTQHRSCPQSWFYGSMMKLERIPSNEAKVELEFGNWWHALRAAESIERGRSLGSLKSVPKMLGTVDNGPEIPTEQQTVVEAVFAAALKWESELSSTKHEVWQARLGGGLTERLRYVNDRWIEQWEAERKFEEPLAVEYRWRRELPSVKQPSGELVDPDTAMVGYIDEVYYDKRRGIVVARDHKSHKGLSNQTTLDDMMDSQLQVYAWGGAPEIEAWGYGPIRAVAYDRVRTTKPSKPALTAGGGLSKSTSDYDLRTYLDFVGEGIPWGEPDTYVLSGPRKGTPKWGTYQVDPAVVEHLSSPVTVSRWMQRTLTPLNRNIVTAHLRAAVDTALDMTLTRQRAAQSGQAARNLSESNCRWCDFQGLCRAQMVGGAEGDYDLEALGLREKP